jgi:hypothetical protein
MWELARERGDITPSLIDELPRVIARQDSPHFELLWQAASRQQKNLLIALSEKATPSFSPGSFT